MKTKVSTIWHKIAAYLVKCEHNLATNQLIIKTIVSTIWKISLYFLLVHIRNGNKCSLCQKNRNNPLGNLIRVDNLEFCHASTPCGVPLAESGKKSERRSSSSSTFFCIPNLQSRLISSFGMQLIAAVNSTNWKIVVTLFMFLIGRTQLLSNSMPLTTTVEN